MQVVVRVRPALGEEVNAAPAVTCSPSQEQVQVNIMPAWQSMHRILASQPASTSFRLCSQRGLARSLSCQHMWGRPQPRPLLSMPAWMAGHPR